MRPHPRVARPDGDLPDHVREVLLAPGWAGFTAIVWRHDEVGAMATIPLMGCRQECEGWLREALREDHGFSEEQAVNVARALFDQAGRRAAESA